MIECDYEFKRIEGNKEFRYSPHKSIKKINNISYIKAPNSFGKSTYLNLIALCFWAHKNETIDPDLRRKIVSLINSDNQKIAFNISISSKNGDIQIIATKKDYESSTFKVEEVRNGKKEILTPVNIEKKYKIIYDLPRNPATRLKQLTEEIGEEQNIIGRRINQLRTRVQQILQEIQDSKDPKYIATLEKRLSEFEMGFESVKKLIMEIEKEKHNIEMYFYYRFYNEYQSKYNELALKCKNVDKRVKKEIRKRKFDNTAYYKAYENAKDEIDRMKGLKQILDSDLSKIIPEKKGLLKVWDRINPDKALEEYQISETFIECLLEIDRILGEELEKSKTSGDAQETEVYKQLMNTLEEYLHLDININVGNHKTITSFYDEIKKLYMKKYASLSDYNLIKDAIKTINELDNVKRNLQNKYLPSLRKARGKVSSEEIQAVKQSKAEEDVGKYQIVMERLKEKLLKYQANYQIFDSPSLKELTSLLSKDELYTFSKMKENNLKEKIEMIQNELLNYKTDKAEKKRKIKNLREEIINLKKKKEHPYKECQKKFEKLGEIVKKMDFKVNNNFTEYLKDIRKGILSSNISKEQEKYNEKVFSYLGKRMGEIRIHTGENIQVEKVNLFNGTLLSTKGGKYLLDQMGTGQTQAAYLKSLLSTEDDRLIIAMFDEVGMMDETTLSQVKEKIKELYNSNRLLMGLIVQKRDEGVEISNME